jgi:hypothetical protein
MQRWQTYMAAAEADHRRAEHEPVDEQPQHPTSLDTPDVGAPWFPDGEPVQPAT